MSPLIMIIGGGIVLIGIVAVVAVIMLRRPQTAGGDLNDRLAEYANRDIPISSLDDIEMSQPFTERVLVPMMNGVAGLMSRLAPKQMMEKSQRDLEMAGRPVRSPEMFTAIKAVAAGILAFLAFLILTITGQQIGLILLFTVVGGAIGFILPGVWLGSKISQRQEEIVKSLPDALDLLVICVEAGLGFEGAMAKVAEKWDNELSRGFARALQEIRLGKFRNDALREMELNMGVPDMTSFVAAIIQATQFGVSISKVLRIQSEQMRIKRRQRAEQKAQEAPIKMLFPMVFLIFPSLFIVLLGPAALLLMESGVMDAM